MRSIPGRLALSALLCLWTTPLWAAPPHAVGKLPLQPLFLLSIEQSPVSSAQLFPLLETTANHPMLTALAVKDRQLCRFFIHHARRSSSGEPSMLLLFSSPHLFDPAPRFLIFTSRPPDSAPLDGLIALSVPGGSLIGHDALLLNILARQWGKGEVQEWQRVLERELTGKEDPLLIYGAVDRLLGLSALLPVDQNIRSLSAELRSFKHAILRLNRSTQGFEVEMTALGVPDASPSVLRIPLRLQAQYKDAQKSTLHGSFHTDFKTTFGPFMAAYKRLDPYGMDGLKFTCAELAQLTGIDPIRDFVRSWRGEAEWTVQPSPSKNPGFELRLSTHKSKELKSTLNAVARWGKALREDGVVRNPLQRAGQDRWHVTGSPGGEPLAIRLLDEAAHLSLGNLSERDKTDSPDVTMDYRQLSERLRLSLRWKRSDDLSAMVICAAQALRILQDRLMPQSNLPLGAICLREIVAAHQSFELLELQAPVDDPWDRLALARDASRRPVDLLPNRLLAARWPDGIPLAGYRFAPVKNQQGRFVAIADGVAAVQIFATDKQGIVYRAPQSFAAPKDPTILPPDWPKNWIAITPKWK